MKGWWSALVLAACGRTPEVGLPPGALIGPCDGWVGGACLQDVPKPLVVWFPDALSDAAVTVDGAVIPLEVEPRGGRLAQLGEADGVEIAIGEDRWRTEVRPSGDSPAVRAMWQAWEHRKEEPDALAPLADLGLTSPDTETRAVALDMQSRLADMKGDHAMAAEHLRAAQAQYAAVGRSDRALRLLVNHGVKVHESPGGWTEAEAMIAEVVAASDPRLDILALRAWLEGALGRQRGDVRRAVQADRLSTWAYRLIRYDRTVLAESDLAGELQASGLHAEALHIDAGHVAWATDDDPVQCWPSWSRSQYGYSLVIAAEAGVDVGAIDDPLLREVGTDAVALLQSAKDAYRPTCRREVGFYEDLLTNLALALLHAGRLDEALATLATLATRPPTASQTARWFEGERIRGEIALQRGDAAAALAAFQLASDRALQIDQGRGLLLSMAGRARALTALGRVDEALQAFAAADERARLFAVALPLDQGRDAFLTEWDRMAGDWIALLVRSHREAEAATVLRDLRGAVLSQLVWARATANLTPDEASRWQGAVQRFTALQESMQAGQRDAWKLSARERAAADLTAAAKLAEMKAIIDQGLPERVLRLDAPRAKPGPGELLVTWAETTGGVYAFALGETGTRVAGPFPRPVDDDGPTSAWFLPIADALRAAKRVVLLPAGRLRAEDLHVRRLDGAPLIDRAEVVWSLDLPERPASAPGSGAVVLADPLEDLENARLEGEQVSAALAAAGLPTQLWSGGEATAPRLAEGLGSAALLHYAGHGRAGEDALSAELLLADHQTFAVSNALGSPRVPARVVLSGCETARSVATDVESLGLGQAFVVAGSSAVIAAVRPVDDRAARVLIDGLYAAGVAQGDPAAAFRAAVRGAMAQGVDVSAFRLLVP